MKVKIIKTMRKNHFDELEELYYTASTQDITQYLFNFILLSDLIRVSYNFDMDISNKS